MNSSNETFSDLMYRIHTRLEQSSAAFTDIDKTLDGRCFSATSVRGNVVAIADRNGQVVSLDVVDVTMTRVPVTELERQVVEAVRHVQAEAERAFLRMLVDRLGPLPGRSEEVQP